jgi:ABC-2 type transport system ATP-binding protein
VPESNFNDELLRVSEITEIKDVLRTLIRQLSLGYKKRVGIAQALIGSPPVLFFDEPVSGLDPRQIVEIRNLIRSLSGKHTVLLSSHILAEVSRTCDRVLIVHKGKLAGDISGEKLENIEEIFLDLTKGVPEVLS